MSRMQPNAVSHNRMRLHSKTVGKRQIKTLNLYSLPLIDITHWSTLAARCVNYQPASHRASSCLPESRDQQLGAWSSSNSRYNAEEVRTTIAAASNSNIFPTRGLHELPRQVWSIQSSLQYKPNPSPVAAVSGVLPLTDGFAWCVRSTEATRFCHHCPHQWPASQARQVSKAAWVTKYVVLFFFICQILSQTKINTRKDQRQGQQTRETSEDQQIEF